MKLKRMVALALALVLLMTALVGCSSKGKTLLKLEKEKITVNTVYLFLSRMKGYVVSAHGDAAYNDSFWDTLMDTDGKTYDEYYTDQIIENAKTYAAAMHLFRERGLELSDEALDAIDAELEEIINNEWNGSKTEFNAKLAEYGANYDVLREAKTIEAKIECLRDDLFGTDGEKIGDELKEEYYRKNYRRFKHMFFYTYHFVTETDSEGNEKIVTGADGYPLTKDMTEKEIRLVIDRANEAMGKAVTKEENGKKYGDEALFDALLAEKNNEGKYLYSEDVGMQLYPNGIYLTAESNYDTPEVIEALFDMDEGEIRLIRSADGFHVLMRYHNDEGAYAEDANEDSFADFVPKLEDILLSDYLRKYKELVEVDEKALEGLSIKNVSPNLHY